MVKKIEWAIGIEHEMHIFKKNTSNIKHYDIIDTEDICYNILSNWTKYKKIYKTDILSFSDKDYDFLTEILMRKFESTGRKCNGRWVLKPVSNHKKVAINMPEFVTVNPFSCNTIESYCKQLDDQQSLFLRYMTKCSKKLKEDKHELIAFPFGMTNYMKVEKVKKLQKDYTGSFHITLTLPFTKLTTNERFIENHKNFANMFQWIEPLLVSGFFSGDDTAIGTPLRKIKGSYRVCSVGWGNFAGSDVSKFNRGIGRFTNLVFDWRDGMDYHESEKVKRCNYIKDISKVTEPYAKSRYSSNFRTFGGPKHESGYKMEKPSGVEIRIFDNIPIHQTEPLSKLIINIAEHSRKNKCNKYVYHDKDWINALQTTMMDGWKAKLPVSYINKLRKNLKLKLDTDSTLNFDILQCLKDELLEKNKNGLWTKQMLKSNNKIDLPCINRSSLECGYCIRLNNNTDLRKKLINMYKKLEKQSNLTSFETHLYKHLSKKDYQSDIEDIIYFLETLNLVELIILDGNIVNIIKKNENSIDRKMKVHELSRTIMNHLRVKSTNNVNKKMLYEILKEK
jgi:hypothetical protein